MPTCNDCGEEMDWGMEYQLDHGTDHVCVCPDCWTRRKNPRFANP